MLSTRIAFCNFWKFSRSAARDERLERIERSKVERVVGFDPKDRDSTTLGGRKEARWRASFSGFRCRAGRTSRLPLLGERGGEITVDSPFGRAAPEKRSAVVKLLNLSPPVRLKITVIYYFLLLNDAATEYGPGYALPYPVSTPVPLLLSRPRRAFQPRRGFFPSARPSRIKLAAINSPLLARFFADRLCISWLTTRFFFSFFSFPCDRRLCSWLLRCGRMGIRYTA